MHFVRFVVDFVPKEQADGDLFTYDQTVSTITIVIVNKPNEQQRDCVIACL
jgi:hypothetical protein